MTPTRSSPSAFVRVASLALLLSASSTLAADRSDGTPESRRADYFARFAADQRPPSPLAPEHLQECIAGFAGPYPCDNVDLLEFLPVATIGGGSMNDVWGWTDPLDGKEYALAGRTNGTAFVDISNPTHAVYLGNLPTHTGSSSWRDVKTHGNYAFIVSDNNGIHGMQVFDLTRLRGVASPPVTFTEDAWYGNIGSAHNIAINEATGYAYLIGGSSGTTQCSGGLHMVDLQNPLVPAFAGCYSAHGYTHDTQCVVYDGPDVEHLGKEICFSSNGPTERLGIVDVTNKAAPVALSSTPYSGSSYPHQGWLTEDHTYFLLDDELDEGDFGHNTRTRVWDLTDLEAPQLLGHFSSPTAAIDHNQYIRGNYAFQANYRSGLRILRLDDPAQATLSQVGFFDTYPSSDSASFSGAWSVYPYFESGVVIVTSIGEGLFVLQPTNLCETPASPSALAATAAGDNQIDLSWTGSGVSGNEFVVERALGGCGGAFEILASGLTVQSFSDLTPSGGITYGYRVREVDESGFCQSGFSACDEASTTGSCTAPPTFAGLESASSPGAATCLVQLGWSAASPLCSGPVTYNVYRDANPDFVPSIGNQIATGVLGTSFTDYGAPPLSPVSYVVRAVDSSSSAEETNNAHRSTSATGPVVDGTYEAGGEAGDPPLDTLAEGSSSLAPEHAGWHVVDERKHTGLNSYHSSTGSNICTTLEGDVTLTAAQSSQLSFWTAYAIESGWDGGVIDVSTNGGGDWTRLTPSGGYPGTIANAGNQCGIAVGNGAFTGTNLTFQLKNVSLASYAGQTIRLRWQYSSDGLENLEGWYVDDIVISHAQVPSTCAPNGIFLDGFESSDTDAWSSVAP